jgi:hypothetical protein
MLIDPYTTRELYACVAILKTLRSQGLDSIFDALNHLEQSLPIQPEKTELSPDKKMKHQRRLCPSCRSGWLIPVSNPEGLTISGCKRCRYSEVGTQ